MLIKVSEANPGDVRARLQPALFAQTPPAPPPGCQEEEILAQFREQVALPGEPPLPAAVLFPSLPRAALQKLPPGDRPADALWLAKEELVPERFGNWLERHLSAPLSETAIARLREAFTPEVVIPATFTVREPIERRTGAELTGYLLDYRQEQVLKTDLDLSQDAHTVVREFGIRLVGGGQRQIADHRHQGTCCLLPRKRILVLTHNRPLIRDLKRYRQLSNGDRKVSGATSFGWCRRAQPRLPAAHYHL